MTTVAHKIPEVTDKYVLYQSPSQFPIGAMVHIGEPGSVWGVDHGEKLQENLRREALLYRRDFVRFRAKEMLLWARESRVVGF
jgi:hypothetical protein